MASYFLSSLLVLSFLTLVSANPEDNEIDFTYWGKENGVKEWGKMYRTCSEGKTQSPININTFQTAPSKHLPPLTRFYNPAQAFLVDNGANIGVRYASDHASMVIDGKNYTMRFMHWHSPSEHRLNGVQYPLELHLVHEAPDKSLAVVGLLYEFGQPDQFIESLNSSLSKLNEMVKEGKKPAEVELGMLDIKLLGKQTNKYYRYIGSLTSPPCSEPVIWTVLPRVRTVSEEQVEALRAPLEEEFKYNSRPTQPLNGREVLMYDSI